MGVGPGVSGVALPFFDPDVLGGGTSDTIPDGPSYMTKGTP